MPARASGRATVDQRAVPWTWQQRLRRIMSFPDYEDANRFLSDVASPAMKQVCVELGELGVEATVKDDKDEDGVRFVELIAELGEESPFR